MKTEKKRWQQKIADFWFAAVTTRRKLTISLLLIVLVIGVLGLGQLQIDDSYEAMFVDDDPIVQDQERFEEVFDEENMNFILVENENGVFTEETMSYLSRVTIELEEQVPFIEEVVSLANIETLETVNDSLETRELVGPEIPATETELAEIEETVMNSKGSIRDLVSDDGQASGIIITTRDTPDSVYAEIEGQFDPLGQGETREEVILAEDIQLESDDGLTEIEEPRMLIAPAIYAILSDHTQEDISATAAGLDIVFFESEKLIVEEFGTVGVLAFLASALLMLIIFKSFRALGSSLLVIIIGVVILFGAQGWLGVPINIQSLLVMILVMVISVGYSIHFINHFFYKLRQTGKRLQAVRYAFNESTWAIFFTALTTMIGFLSFLVVPITPIRAVGLTCAAAAIVTYVLVMVVIPLVFLPGKDKEVDETKKSRESFFERFISSWSDVVTTHIKPIIALSIILILVLTYGVFQISITSDTTEMMGDEIDYVRNARYIGERLGFLYTYDLLIELPEEGMGQQSDVLLPLNQFQEEIEDSAGTAGVNSLANLLREINMIMNDNNPEYYTVPEDDQLISQYLLLYEMSGGEGLESVVDFGYENLRMSVQINDTADETLNNIREIEERGNQYFSDDIEISKVGELAMALRSMDLLGSGQINSIAIAIIVIGLIMILILKNLKMGLISVIPVALSVLSIMGVMGLTDMNLDLVTIMISPMVIGIAIDDTVHYFLHYKEEFTRTGSYREANRKTFKKIARALISTSVVLMIGFGILSLVRFQAYTNMGILAVLGIFVALAANLIVAPALLTFLKPLGSESVTLTPERD